MGGYHYYRNRFPSRWWRRNRLRDYAFDDFYYDYPPILNRFDGCCDFNRFDNCCWDNGIGRFDNCCNGLGWRTGFRGFW